MPPVLTQAFSGYGAAVPDAGSDRPEPVVGIAARLTADTPLTDGAADALSALLRLMAPECADEKFGEDLGAVREALVRHPNVRAESLLDGRIERFTAVLTLGGLPALLLLDIFHDAKQLVREAPDGLVLRGMPWFVLGTDLPATENASVKEGEEPEIRIFTGEGTENIMCALSLEDAARFWKFAVTLDSTPLRRPGSLAGVYGRALTQPGACSFLCASGGTFSRRVEALLRTLEKGADILERRLDAARAGVAEGRAIERRLLATISHTH